MDKDQTNVFVRGRCACGKRFRVRNAQPGMIVTCPNCGRPISITAADLRIATSGERLVPLQPDQAEAPEAVLLDDADLRPATTGSGPGLTGRSAESHSDALVCEAARGTAVRSTSLKRPTTSAVSAEETAPSKGGAATGTFVGDLLSSFYFAGIPRNGLVCLTTMLVCLVPWMFGMFIAGYLPWLMSLLMAVAVRVYAVAVVVSFLWRALTVTARGEDVIPLFDAAWDTWENLIKPLVWMATITFVCALPALLIRWFAPVAAPYDVLLLAAALVVGSLFWPVAVMSVAIGEHLVFIRPDWLIRCLLGIGPVYLIAWLQIMVMSGAIAALVIGGSPAMGIPLLERLLYPLCVALVTFYFGYVLFRTLGLLYRHYARRFPWRL